MVDPLGQVGPHPDIVASIAAGLNAVDSGADVRPEQLTLLSQRTFHDLPHPRTNKPFSVTSTLSILNQGEQSALILCQLGREEGKDRWRLMSVVTADLGRPSQAFPFVTTLNVLPKIGLAVGLVGPGSQGAAALRIELADGTIVEDAIAGTHLQLFVPFRSPEAWAREAITSVLDSTGNSILSQRVYVNPARPPGVGPASASA